MTGVKSSIADDYSEQAHFIYELLQNADDTKATEVRFELKQDGLFFTHNGTIHFSISDPKMEGEDTKNGNLGHINSITSIGNTTKSESEIGKFGIGFKSVFQYTDTPHIYDPPFMFKIERFIVPVLLEKDCNKRVDNNTLFYFPFDSDEKTKEKAFGEIKSLLHDLKGNPLLFLRSLKKITWEIDKDEGIYEKKVNPKDPGYIISLPVSFNGRCSESKFLLFDTCIKDKSERKHTISIVFNLSLDNKSRIIPDQKFPAYCFFATKHETGLRFILHAPFLLTNSREGIMEGKEWNECLIRESAKLVSETIPRIKELGLLNIDFLEVLPVSEEDIPTHSMFRPIYDAVLEKLKSEEKLLPAEGGGHINADKACLLAERAPEVLVDLLGTEQLSLLFGKDGVQWIDRNITEKSSLTVYLRDKVNITQVSPEYFVTKFKDVSRLTNDKFIKEQSDEWVIQFYKFLNKREALWRKGNGPLRNEYFIRLENNTHVPPFWRNKKPGGYLPGSSESSFPTVKKTIAENKEAREFLEKLGLNEPDIVAEVIEGVLPKYNKNIISVSDEDNIEDIKKILKALERSKIDNLEFKYILKAVNHKKEIKWCRPLCVMEAIYLPESFTGKRDLETYFEGNPNAYFLDDLYEKFSKENLCSKLGCMDEVWVKCRNADKNDNVIICNEHSNHIKGLDKFDPSCTIDGLKQALDNISVEKAKIIWKILIQYRHSIAGTVKSSTQQYFPDPNTKTESKHSNMGRLVRQESWLPDKSYKFHKPSEILLSDLPDGFENESPPAKDLAAKLGLRNIIVEQLVDQLSHIEKIRFELAQKIDMEVLIRLADKTKAATKDDDENDDLNYLDELNNVFSRHQTNDSGVTFYPPDPVHDPDRRDNKIREEIETDQGNEPSRLKRFKRVPTKKWEQKDNAVRGFLVNEYGGQCQICDNTFTKRDGGPYFEGLYIVSRTKASWIDRPGNVLCLCANCCAKFLHGEVVADKIEEQIKSLRCQNEDGDENLTVELKLCGKSKTLRFTERHLIELRGLMKVSEEG